MASDGGTAPHVRLAWMGSAVRGWPSSGARTETPSAEHHARRQPLRATFPSQGRRGKRSSTDVGKRRIGDQEIRPQRFQKNAAGGKPGAFGRRELLRTAAIRQNLQVPSQPRRRGSEARPRRRRCRPGHRTGPHRLPRCRNLQGSRGHPFPPERSGKPARTPGRTHPSGPYP